MNATAKNERIYRVTLVNRQTLGAACGWGEGRTLAEAQRDAIRIANQRQNAMPQISPGGYQCYFNGGINC